MLDNRKNMRKGFSLLKRIKSFKHAINGLCLLIKEEHNSRIHLLAAILAITAGYYFDISTAEWLMIVIAIGAVFGAELLNSAIENTADAVTEEHHPKIKKAKDLAAGAVLVVSIMAFVIGMIIFIPKL